MTKDFVYKVYDRNLNFKHTIKTADIKSEITFTNILNFGQGELTLVLGGEENFYTDKILNTDIIKIFEFDENNNLGRLIYSGIAQHVRKIQNSDSREVIVPLIGIGSIFSYITYSQSFDDTPGNIISSIVDLINLDYNIFTKNIDTSGTNVIIDNNYDTAINIIKKVRDLTGKDFFIGPTGEVSFNNGFNVLHNLKLGKEVSELEVSDDTEGLVNYLTLQWTGGSNYYEDTTSQTTYGVRKRTIINSGILTQEEADLFGQQYILDNKDKIKKTTIKVNNRYDIESIKPGERVTVIGGGVENIKIVKTEYIKDFVYLYLETVNSFGSNFIDNGVSSTSGGVQIPTTGGGGGGSSEAYTEITADYTATADDQRIVNKANVDITLTMPDGVSSGKTYKIKNDSQGGPGFVENKTKMLSARRDFATAAVNNNIYLMGGQSKLSNNEEYNTDTDSWTTKADLITGLEIACATGAGSNVHLFGGKYSQYSKNDNFAFDIGNGTWSQKADMPTGRERSTSSVVSGKIYVIGGLKGSSHLDTNEEYDPSTDTWTTKADMITARKGLTSSTVNDKIYVIGGYDGSNGNLATNEEYDPSANAWTTKTDMITARDFLSSGEVSGKIYVMGGGTDKNEEYDPSTDTWTTKANMSDRREKMTISVSNSKIYVFGGNKSNSDLKTCEEYDPGTDTWTTKNDMQTGRIDLASVEYNGLIYVMGGYNSNSYLYTLDIVEIYDVANNSWTTGVDMLRDTSKMSASIVDGIIYIFGGYQLQHLSNSHYIFDTLNNSWTKGKRMQKGRINGKSVNLNGKIHVIGGSIFNDQYSASNEIYDIANESWATGTDMNTGRRELGVSKANGKIYAVGGYNSDDKRLDVNEEYDQEGDSWTTKAVMPTARNGLTVSGALGKIYAIGGFESSGDDVRFDLIEEYNPVTDSWEQKVSLTNKRTRHGAESVNDTIFVMGGSDTSSNVLSSNEAYTPGITRLTITGSIDGGDKVLKTGSKAELFFDGTNYTER